MVMWRMPTAVRVLPFVCCAALLPQTSEAIITYTNHLGGVSSGIRTQIENSIREAVDFYNANGNFNKNLNIYYNAGVPTANANYNGVINFGGSRNTRVALHEIMHTIGVGTTSQYRSLMTGGTWDGAVANALIARFDGSGNGLRGDSVHLWPYGLNFDTEDSSTNRLRHVKIAEAVQCDMGLGPCPAGTPAGGDRQVIGKQSGRAMDAVGNANGGNVQIYGFWGGANQRWEVVSHGGDVYSFRTKQDGGRALDVYEWGTTSGTNIVMWPYSGQNVQRFNVQAASNGYYRIKPVIASSLCVVAAGSGNNANVQLGSCSGDAALWAIV